MKFSDLYEIKIVLADVDAEFEAMICAHKTKPVKEGDAERDRIFIKLRDVENTQRKTPLASGPAWLKLNDTNATILRHVFGDDIDAVVGKVISLVPQGGGNAGHKWLRIRVDTL